MGWPLLHVTREQWMGDNRWGRLSIRALPTGWEFLSYSYELPWREDDRGLSRSNLSRIKIGTYTMKVREDGPKGWRLELKGTGHRKFIQVHRAAPNLYIEGCILPIHFRSHTPRSAPASDPNYQVQSVQLMKVIKERYEFLAELEDGEPEIQISGTLPATGGPPGVFA